MPAYRTCALVAAVSLSTAALAAPPNACAIITVADVNPISDRPVERSRPQKTGNPSECVFLDSRNGAVLIVSLREVQYAVKDELDVERVNAEKIYRVKSKPIDYVGESGFWLGANKSMVFRKGKLIVSVSFQTPTNQNEIDTGQIARLVESRLK